ncbi:TIR domain protein [Caballeronia arationis]|uniref:toll/interleukin-1 receptor domain-containing protein n=1 Tax=Caballeronia arationis TaxID=1777142 RepID=UPI00074C3D2B|nr:toll/interleukin-1 receptor domain-containing protein [Caballeronia arationis]SAL04302.1 TIR domain protein [Caballeronia arationis]
MPSVPGYDIFISYAHADDEVPQGAGTPSGWVSSLAYNLNVGPNVRKKKIYIDHRLKPGDNFSAQLIDKVCACKLLIILLSQNYIDSEWCGKELERFVASHTNDPEKPTDVFVVELAPYEELVKVPDNIAQLRKRNIHAKFWDHPINAKSPILAGYPTPQGCSREIEQLYWSMLGELQRAVDERLREMGDGREESSRQPLVFPGTDAKPLSMAKPNLGTILLADVTDDLEALRNRLKLELESEGITVLPVDGDYVGLGADEFYNSIADDLKHSDLFVQMLSSHAGRKGRGFAAPLPQLQLRSAREANRPVMQWCDHLPGPGEIDDPAHGKLFDTPYIRAATLTTFASEVVKRLREIKQPCAGPGPLRRTLFLDDLAGEPGLKERVREILKAENWDIRRLPASASLGGNGIDIAELLKPCRAGITLYVDQSKHTTVCNRLLYFLNQVALSSLPVERWGVYMERGSVADEFGIESDDVVELSEGGLIAFVRGLQR